MGNKKETNRATGDKKEKKQAHPIRRALGWFFTLPLPVALGLFLWLGKRWVFSLWAELDVNEVIYQLNAPLEGTGNGMIGSFIISDVVPTIIVSIAVSILLFLLKTRLKGEGKTWYKTIRVIVPLLGLALFAYSFHGFWVRMDVGGYIADQMNTSTFIEDYYVAPADAQLTFPEKKRNLIMIYLESMEVTYADPEHGGAFPQNAIPELTALAEENEDFSGSDDTLNGGRVLPGTGFTMGAMFGISTGLPLKTDVKGITKDFVKENNLFEGNDMSTQEHFYDKVDAIGDVLAAEGYNQIFLLGSNASFGGRRLFFNIHGDYSIRDYNYAKQNGWIDPDYSVFWGYEDEKLFEYARNLLLDPEMGREPFNLTLLTVDTHFEDGYVCRLCGNEFGDNQYANVMACSSRQVAEFVEWCQQQDFYENTTIVITGDHTTMDHDFCENVPEDYLRRTYTSIINAAKTPADPARRRDYSTLDIFPTALSAMGVEIPGGRLGLGTDLFSSTDTLIEELGSDYVYTEIRRRSSFMESLSDIDLFGAAKDKKGINPVGTLSLTGIDDAGNATFLLNDIKDLNANIKSATLELYLTASADPENPDILSSVEMTPVSDKVYTATVPLDGHALGDLSVRASIVAKTGGTAKLADKHDLRFIVTDPHIYFREIPGLLEDGNHSLLLSVRGDASDALSDQLREDLHALGLQEELTSGCSYYAMISGDQIIENYSPSEKISETTALPDGAELLLISAGTSSGDTATIKLDGHHRSLNKRGINIVLYDHAESQLLDQVSFDTHELLSDGTYKCTR